MAAAVRSLADLVTEIRQRCDQENSDFVSDAELESWINQSAAALLDIIVDYAGPDAFVASKAIATIAGTDTYDLDATTYRVTGVDVQFSGRWRELDRASFADRHRFQDGGWSGPADTRYMLAGRGATGTLKIRFVPSPPAVFDVRVWYIPLQTTLNASTDLVAFNGWDEWVVADVCAKVAEKEESDARPFIARKAEAQLRIIQAAKALDSARALRMRDVGPSSLVEDEVEPLWRD